MTDTQKQNLATLVAKCVDKKATGAIMLNVNVRKIQQGQQGGYPIDMYHETEAPVFVTSDELEQIYAEHGYRRQYIKQFYPKFVFRRNLNPEFKGRDWMEEKCVKDEKDEARVRALKRPSGCGPWCNELAELEELPARRVESPEVTIARLEAQLEAEKAKVLVAQSDEEETGKRKGK